MTSLHAKLEARLRNSYSVYAAGRNLPARPSVALPRPKRPPTTAGLGAAPLIQFEGTEQAVVIRLSAKAVVANMQANAASFEAWSLILRAWCEVDEVLLAWSPPDDLHDPHYQRFLYRTERFRSLFPGWFDVADESLLSASRIDRASGRDLLLNIPSKQRPTLEQYLSRDRSRPLGDELLLELALCHSAPFAHHYGLDLDFVERQIPVGLFVEKVAAAKRIFSGGKSAIDLVGMSGKTLWLFELKAGGNIPAGILSELFFYTAVLRDASSAGPFSFSSTTPAPIRVTAGHLAGCSRIEAVMLGEQLHPLVEGPRIVSLLNDAVGAAWNTQPGYPQVQFRADRVVHRDPLEIKSAV